ncbi:PQQ-binding-like beta-propeller repeat protein [Streptomyces profundus]|uniref:outer membrane protein assembly factor BamB family protein n=1 Tax=Streptomyces profundus TaxID=2867410 RepID=UPI001D168DF9|nr:PQQ-binding-like beta-propeller repeat protein [Streptomyces sp. MA3_2.13]UED83538.1 PQQ-binding-like beta-propeller repeat protein [Streptomyces sp. MA3_2.13]
MARRGRRPVPWVIAGAALLASLAMVLVVLLGGDEGPTEVWRAESGGNGGELDLALWAHDGVVTRVGPTAAEDVTGYDAADGTVLWETPAPVGTYGPCAASEHTNAEGVGAVLHHSGEAEGCTVVTVIDTHDGEVLWSRDLSGLGPSPVDDTVTATVGEATLTVNLSPANAAASFQRFDLASGEPLPALAPVADGDCDHGWTPLSIDHADERVVTLATCEGPSGEPLTPPRFANHVHDTATGEHLWSRDMADANEAIADVRYGEPGAPLIVVESGHLVAYTETGEALWRLATDGQGLSERAVADGVLIAEQLDDTSEPVVFEGYAVDSGERMWRGEFPPLTSFLGADDADGVALLGSYHYQRGEGGQLTLTWLDLADGTGSDIGTVPFPLERGLIASSAAIDADRLYLGGPLEPEVRLRAFAR